MFGQNMEKGFAIPFFNKPRKEPWFRNHVCNRNKLPQHFAAQVAVPRREGGNLGEHTRPRVLFPTPPSETAWNGLGRPVFGEGAKDNTRGRVCSPWMLRAPHNIRHFESYTITVHAGFYSERTIGVSSPLRRSPDSVPSILPTITYPYEIGCLALIQPFSPMRRQSSRPSSWPLSGSQTGHSRGGRSEDGFRASAHGRSTSFQHL